MTKTLAAAIAALAIVATPAAAGTLAGVTMPDTDTVEGKALVLNGLGLREATFLKIDVYVAGLYLETKTSDPAAILAPGQVKRLRMDFVRGVGRGDIVKSWEEGLKKNVKDQGPVRDRFEKLYSVMTDVAEGDSMVLTDLPGTGVTVSLKGKELATLPGDDFARALWSIWFGPNPPNAELKEGLLGK